jgi:exosome complex component RRP43
MDPTSFEEPLLDATITVTLDQEENLLCVTQAGLITTGEAVIEKTIAIAKSQARFLKQKQLLTT